MTQEQNQNAENEENKAIQDDEPDQFETPVTTEDEEQNSNSDENSGA
ncbi:hypothetical protein [Paenibacillus sp. DCT19]|nr:hypothetical protein [Paenibacillus sp. DCT19]